MNIKIFFIIGSFFGLFQSSLLFSNQAFANQIHNILAPPRPCDEGVSLSYVTRYQKVDDLHSCPQHKFTCVIRDQRCPQMMPPSPDFCDNDNYATLPSYIEIDDRLSCMVPQLACVKSELCPLRQPLAPDFCPDGFVSSRIKGFTQVQGKYSCPEYEFACVKIELCDSN